MIRTAPTPPQQHTAEQQVLLQNISWHSYQKILEALGDSYGSLRSNRRAAKLTDFNGPLEIMTPLQNHE